MADQKFLCSVCGPTTVEKCPHNAFFVDNGRTPSIVVDLPPAEDNGEPQVMEVSRCGSRDPIRDEQCDKPRGHDGKHSANLDTEILEWKYGEPHNTQIVQKDETDWECMCGRLLAQHPSEPNDDGSVLYLCDRWMPGVPLPKDDGKATVLFVRPEHTIILSGTWTDEYWVCPECGSNNFGTSPINPFDLDGPRQIGCHGDNCDFKIPQTEWERQHPHEHNADRVREPMVGTVAEAK